jgi:threonine/homoserine/homoserine lactone efflux protein
VSFLPLATTLGSAFVVTFVTVAVPNPSTIGASHYGVRRGARAAAMFLGAVLCLDVVVFFVLVHGLHPLLSALGAARYLKPLAGAGLTIAGLVMVVTVLRNASLPQSMRLSSDAEDRGTAHGPFVAGVLVPAANPGFWIWWTTVGTSFIHAARPWGNVGLGLLLAAFLGGAAAWYVPLVWALSRGRQVLSERAQRVALVILGCAMVGFGVVLLARSVASFR